MVIASVACVLVWGAGQCEATVQPLKATVTLDRTAYALGEPITLTVTITNNSNAPVQALNLSKYGLGFLLECDIWRPCFWTQQGPPVGYSSGVAEPLVGGSDLLGVLAPGRVTSSSSGITAMYQFSSGNFAATMGDMSKVFFPSGSKFNPLLLSNTAFFRVFATAEERDRAVKAGLPELAVEIALGERKVVSSQAPVNTRQGVFAPLMEACQLLEAKVQTRDKTITVTRADRKLTIDTTTGKFTLRIGRRATKGETDLVTAGNKLMVSFRWLAESLGEKNAKLVWRVVEKKG